MTSHSRIIIVFLLCVGFSSFLSGCSARSNTLTLTRPHIILWQSWDEDEASVFNETINRFERIFDIVVVPVSVPREELRSRYRSAIQQGLGPDVMIGSSQWLYELADAGTLAALEPDTVDASAFYAGAISDMTYDDDLYGVPLALRPQVLFYNRNLLGIDNPPATTLDELLRDADGEQRFGTALSTVFAEAVWGIPAYGGQLLDDDGRAVLDQGGLANWFEWLLTAQGTPGIFFSRNRDTLRELFTQRQVAYYVGDAAEIDALRESLGSDALRVAPLPEGPNGPAGPLLHVDAMMFNPTSSARQRDASLRLAEFLTNIEQSTTFMRELSWVPANRRVRVDAQTYPAVSAVLAQTRNAITLPASPQLERLLEEGDEALTRVLEGVLDPAVAADDITLTVNEAFGFDTARTSREPCDVAGELTLWHSWTGESASWLREVTDRFNLRCRDAVIDLAYVREDDLLDEYLEEYRNRTSAPGILIGSSDGLLQLINAEAAMQIPRDRLQPYIAESQAIVRYNETFYAMPLTLETNAFYVDTERINETTLAFDGLLNQAQAGELSVLLPRAAEQSIWGWTAFGAMTVDETGRLQIDPEAGGNWLGWLQRFEQSPGGRVTGSQLVRRRAFLDSEDEGTTTPYYVGNSAEFAALRDEMGAALQVASLPTRAEGSGQARVWARVLVVNPSLDQEAFNLALTFGTYMTNAENQAGLLQATDWLTTNTSTLEALTQDAARADLLRQARQGLVIQRTEANQQTFDLLDDLTRQVLAGNLNPAEAASTLAERNNTLDASTPEPTPEVTPEATAESTANVLSQSSIPSTRTPAPAAPSAEATAEATESTSE